MPVIYKKTSPVADPIKLFFFVFIFSLLSYVILLSMNFFQYVTKMQAYQRKAEKSFIIEEKKVL
jgi:hypothetical protein